MYFKYDRKEDVMNYDNLRIQYRQSHFAVVKIYFMVDYLLYLKKQESFKICPSVSCI